MPCDSVIETKVDLGKVNMDRLAEVLVSEGWSVYRTTSQPGLTASRGGLTLVISDTEGKGVVRTRNGKPDEEVLAQIKRSYAARTVADAAKRFGWRVQKKTESENKTIHMKLGR